MEYVAKAFAIGKKYFSPKVNLELNEATPHVFNHPSSSGKNRFFNLISDTLALGQTPSSIGMQFHIWNEISELIHWKGAYTPLEIRNRLNEFSSFGLPLYISEITIPSVINGVQKEEIQAEIVEDFYRLFFVSHPCAEFCTGICATVPRGGWKATAGAVSSMNFSGKNRPGTGWNT